MVEISAKGRGLVPDLSDIFTDITTPLPGYAIAPNGIEARPVLIQQDETPSSNRFYYGRQPEPPKGGYAEADESGIYRMPIERSWVITYLPTGGAVGSQFRLASLKEGVKATLTTQQYADMDIVPVSGATLPVNPRLVTPFRLAMTLGAAAILIAAGILIYRRSRTPKPRAAGIHLPDKITPLSVVTTLRRFESDYAAELKPDRKAELSKEIAAIERRYFGPGAPESNGDLSEALNRWTTLVRRE